MQIGTRDLFDLIFSACFLGTKPLLRSFSCSPVHDHKSISWLEVALISKLKTKVFLGEDSYFGENAMFSTKFIARLVFPTEGRAASIIISPGLKPFVRLSKSLYPVRRPSISSLKAYAEFVPWHD